MAAVEVQAYQGKQGEELTMKVLQLFYTSCKKGLSSGAGFQTHSMSEGISEEERKEIERYGVYVAPLDLPPQPDEDEIDSLFPVSFSFFRLISGRYCICRSKYVGRDYSGRYGNYFCHALVLESGLWPFYPAQLCGSSVFRDKLTDAELETETTPEPLPPLSLEEVQGQLNYEINFEDVSEFAGEERLDDFKAILSSLLLHEKSHRRVVMCDDAVYIPYWAASLQMAFTVRLAHRLTFTTYTHDPEGMNYLMAFTSRNGGRFAFSEAQRDYEYHVFDFIEEEKSAVEEAFKFNEIVEVGYTLSEENLKEFHDFLDGFELYDVLNGEIDAAHSLFEISRIGIGELDVEAVIAAVSFANNYASPRLLGELADSIEDVAEKISADVTYRTARVMTEFLFKAARQSGVPHHVPNAYAFFFSSLDHLVVNAEKPDKDRAVAFHNDFMMMNREHGEELMAELAAPSRLGQLSDYLARCPSGEKRCALAEIYFTLVVNGIIDMGMSWKDMPAPDSADFLRCCFNGMARSRESLTAVLKCVSKSDIHFTSLVAFALKETDVDVELLLAAFSTALRDKNGGFADSIRSSLVGLGQGEFIFNEFKARLEDEKFSSKFFWLYHETVFSRIPEFSDRYFADAARHYLVGGNVSSLSECVRLLECYREMNDDGLLKWLIELWEREQAPVYPSGKKIVEQYELVRRIKAERKFKTAPDITGMITYGNALGECAEEERRTILPGPDLTGIDKGRYVKFLKWVLPMMLRNIRRPVGHEKTLAYLLGGGHRSELMDRYAACMQKDIKKRWGEGVVEINTFVLFFLGLDMRKEKNSVFKDLRETMEMIIIDTLAAVPEKRLNEFKRNIASFGDLNQAKEKRWKIILRKVAERAPKPMLKQVFSHFFKNVGGGKVGKNG